jgi:hypothetical protein
MACQEQRMHAKLMIHPWLLLQFEFYTLTEYTRMHATLVTHSWLLLLLLLSIEAHPCVAAQSTGPAPTGAPVPHLLSGAPQHQPARSSNSSSSSSRVSVQML